MRLGRAVVMVGLSLLACNGPRVEPLDQVLAGSVEVVDVAATQATVTATTRIEMACSVVYGTDLTYGRQATDSDMDGGAHSTHRVMLRGLSPDTLYHFRLQGAGPDGTLYVGPDQTFRTPAAEALNLGTNVASAARGGVILEVSSVYANDPAWKAENAIDEKPATEWSSAGDGDAAFITVGLSAPRELTGVGMWSRSMVSGMGSKTAEIKRFQVVTDAGAVLGPFDLPDSNQLHAFPVSASAKSLRFEVLSSSGGNTGAVEVAAFAQ